MNARDVENFYNNYKQSLSAIFRVERRLLKESYSYEKWYDTLLFKSRTLREIYAKNLEEYKQIITYIIENPDELSEEVNSEILTHVDFFLSEGFRDYGVTAPVIKAILPFWEKKGNRGKIMDCHYFLGVALLNSRYFGEACNAFTKSLECYDDLFECEEPYWTYRMMCASYFRLLAYVGLNRYSEDILLDYYNRAVELWTDSRIPDWMISPKKKNTIVSILRNIICYSVSAIIDSGEVPGYKLMAIVSDEYAREQKLGESETRCCSGEAVYHKYLRASGKISVEEYKTFLTNEVNNEKERFLTGFSYGTWDFVALFDDELSDEVFSETKLFFMNPSFAFVNYGLCELLGMTDNVSEKLDICLSVYRYFMELPHISGMAMVDVFLFKMLSVMMAHLEDEDIICDCILNLLVHRQMPTAIHVTMVAKLTELIISELLETHPEYFVGIFELDSTDEILKNRERILKLAYDSGICHDVGKLTCTDAINLQVRRIMNEEFEAIKAHPVAGASLLLNNPVMFDHSFVALCHHLFDDGTKGYPAGACLPNDPIRIIIEVVTVCDSIDAMSDTLGRNYAKPKNIDTIMEELTAEAGTRYSDRVVKCIKESPKLLERTQQLLYEERAKVNYDIYRRYVYPDTHFMPEDEKFIRRILPEEVAQIANLMKNPYEEEIGLYEKCPEYCFVMYDGHGNLFGNIFCEMKETDLYVTQIQVLPEHRRKGFGSMLLGYAERNGHDDGLKRVFVREITRNHYDKFGWHNGYLHSEDRLGWFEKSI